VMALLGAKHEARPETLDEAVARRVAFLTAYQDAAYAESYRAFVEKVRAASEPLALPVARNLFKLMAYKDEYEVARLYADRGFAERLASQFSGDVRLTFHLAPPFLGKGGEPVKKAFGPWMMQVFRLLAKFKWLRGSAFDPFGRSAERRQERQLIADYRALIERLLQHTDQTRTDAALELACLPGAIRGFGHVKQASIVKAKAREAELLEARAVK
jgi:indolepyruvate ferredoxin oxidoreductase